MHQRALLSAVLLLLVTTCRPAPARDGNVAAASTITRHYAQSRLAAWNVRASAAGEDCGVLLVEAAVILDDSMVEAFHYGAGAYDVVEGGMDRFRRDRAFRGVAYKDSTGRVWTYGGVTVPEARQLARCR